MQHEPEDLARIISGYWYLASPYSKWRDGLDHAHLMIARIAGKLIKRGLCVYSPIAHTHPIAVQSGIDPFDHSIWLPADKPLADAAGGLLIAGMAGWRDSYGISQEINWFRKRPIFLLDPETLISRMI